MTLLLLAEAASGAVPHPLLAEIADIVAKLGVPLIGAIWVWHSYLRGRTFRRRLEPEINGSITEVDGVHFIAITSSVKNVGLSRAFIRQRGTQIELDRLQVYRATLAHTNPVRIRVGFSPVFEDHRWVEPGEEVHDVRMIQLPRRTDEDIAIKLTLRVLSDEFSIPWARLFSENPPDLLAPDTNAIFRRQIRWAAGCVVPFPQPAPPSLPDDVVMKVITIAHPPKGAAHENRA